MIKRINYSCYRNSKHKFISFSVLGRLDKGEDFFAAAIRETEEETGYVADDLDIYKNKRFKMSQTMRTKLKKKTVMFWLAELKDVTKEPTLRPDEHIAYRWVTKEQAVELCKQPEFAEIMNEFDQAIQNHMS